MVPNVIERGSLNSDSPRERLDDKAQAHNLSKRNYFYICGKVQRKISRHLKTHTTRAEILHALSLPKDSKERKILLEKMHNKGNFKHNAVLQGGFLLTFSKKKTEN